MLRNVAIAFQLKKGLRKNQGFSRRLFIFVCNYFPGFKLNQTLSEIPRTGHKPRWLRSGLWKTSANLWKRSPSSVEKLWNLWGKRAAKTKNCKVSPN
jgi:hypothetical protein